MARYKQSGPRRSTGSASAAGGESSVVGRSRTAGGTVRRRPGETPVRRKKRRMRPGKWKKMKQIQYNIMCCRQ